MGVAAGILELKPTYYQDLCASFMKKRDKICSTLESIGLRPIIPQGAYYVLANASPLPGKIAKKKLCFFCDTRGSQVFRAKHSIMEAVGRS